MGKKGEDTRENIQKVAEQLILKKGYSGTSIDEIIKQANITKGGFFYHFSGKNALAKSLLQRYLVEDEIFFNQLFARAESLSEDPLQQMLIFLKLLAETMANLSDVHPGCLVASFAYESEQFDDDVRELAAEGILSWRKLFVTRLENIKEKYAVKQDVVLDEIADMLSSVLEGGIIMSRVLSDQKILSQQILQHRTYLRFLFGDA